MDRKTALGAAKRVSECLRAGQALDEEDWRRYLGSMLGFIVVELCGLHDTLGALVSAAAQLAQEESSGPKDQH